MIVGAVIAATAGVLAWAFWVHARALASLRSEMAAEHAVERRVWEAERTLLLNRLDPTTAQYPPAVDRPLRTPRAIDLDDDKRFWESRPDLQDMTADVLANGLVEPL